MLSRSNHIKIHGIPVWNFLRIDKILFSKCNKVINCLIVNLPKKFSIFFSVKKCKLNLPWDPLSLHSEDYIRAKKVFLREGWEMDAQQEQTHMPTWGSPPWAGRRKHRLTLGSWALEKIYRVFGRETEWLTSCGERQSWRGNEGGGLFTTLGHGDIWALAAAKGPVWVCGHAPYTVCADVTGSCYHQRQWG